MTGVDYTASTARARAGTRLLSMAASPVKRQILRRLSDQSLSWGEGKEARITSTGREMLFVAFVAERWLQAAPHGPIDFERGEAEEAIAALVDGWSSSIVHAIALRPMGLHELDAALHGVGERGLERRLTAMRHAGLVEVRPEGGGLYAPTEWLRAGIAPLTAAARLERRDPKAGMVPIDALDVGAAFLLTLPLVELPLDLSGACKLGVGLDGDGVTGATARVEAGRVVSCELALDESADSWAIGSAGDWLDTVIEPDAKRVRTGGERLLSSSLVGGLHRTLFGIPIAQQARTHHRYPNKTD